MFPCSRLSFPINTYTTNTLTTEKPKLPSLRITRLLILREESQEAGADGQESQRVKTKRMAYT